MSQSSRPKKHWVCVPTREKTMKIQATSWIELQKFVKNKDYVYIKPNELSKVNPDDVLYFYCHSGYGYTADNTSDFYNISLPFMLSDCNDLNSKDKYYNPREFLKFLQDCGLNSNITTVKIASCNSNVFARLAAQEARNQGIFLNMCISGYAGQLVLCQGDKGGKLAGLEEPYVIKDNKDHWIINEEAFAKGKKSKNDFNAKKHRTDVTVKNLRATANTSQASSSFFSINSASALASGSAASNTSSSNNSLSATQDTLKPK